MGDIHAEKTDQQLLLLELQAAATVMAPPTPASGRDLTAALDILNQMRQSADQVSRLLNLAAQAVTSFQANRLEVAGRETP